MKDKIKAISGFFKQMKELKKQEWEHYLNYPSSKRVDSLVDFAIRIVARAYRLSKIHHKGVLKDIKTPLVLCIC